MIGRVFGVPGTGVPADGVILDVASGTAGRVAPQLAARAAAGPGWWAWT